MYPLNGRPLIDYTIDAAFRSKLDDFVITTDDREIAQLGQAIIRPSSLAQDDTPMLPVIQHAVRHYESKHKSVKVDAVMILQPTSPLRNLDDVNEALTVFKESGADSLYSGYCLGIKHKDRPYDKHKEKPHFQRNGAIFITMRELLDRGKLWSDNVVEFEMPKSRSIDIDDMDDLFLAEAILQAQGGRRQ